MEKDFFKPGRTAIRARAVLSLAGERPARGWDALTAPLTPVYDGVVAAENGRILCVEPYAEYRRRPGALPPEAVEDLGDCVIAPGLVNCHTHLELSWMRGKTSRGNGFLDWVASLVTLDRAGGGAFVRPALHDAARHMRQTGTALAGDISNRMPETALQVGREENLALRSFLEIIGHDPEAPAKAAADAGSDAAFALAGHAFYSTPAESFVAARAWCEARGLPFSLHLAEHEDETECLFGRGRFFERLRNVLIPKSWQAPRMRPVAYAAALGLLRAGTLAVHCVTCDAGEIDVLSASGAAICLCPRSNEYIGVGEAPAAAFAARGALLVLGTDSLASNDDLTLWNEAEYFFQKNILPANALLRMATVNGASVLGRSGDFGRLEKNMRFCYSIFPSEMLTLFTGPVKG